jgi:hypothetical protein
MTAVTVVRQPEDRRKILSFQLEMFENWGDCARRQYHWCGGIRLFGARSWIIHPFRAKCINKSGTIWKKYAKYTKNFVAPATKWGNKG